MLLGNKVRMFFIYDVFCKASTLRGSGQSLVFSDFYVEVENHKVTQLVGSIFEKK